MNSLRNVIVQCDQKVLGLKSKFFFKNSRIEFIEKILVSNLLKHFRK
jgi:hypothetical protein